MEAAARLTLNRIAFWQGQMLSAADFRTQISTAEQLRWWHNRSLHTAFGIRFGLDVTRVVGADSVEVWCGVAYDCFGRELVLDRPQRVPFPEVADSDTRSRALVLTHHAAHRGSSCCEARPDPCWPASPSNGENPIAFTWIVERELGTDDGVPLARFVPGSEDPIDPGFIVPSARPIARPHVASGATIPGNTTWEVWFDDIFDAEGRVRRVALGMQTRIDTSAGGFTRVPRYFAQLEGPLGDTSGRQLLPAFFASIADATITGFTFRLLMRSVPRQVIEFSTRALTIQDISHGDGETVLTVKNPELLKQGMTVVRVPGRGRARGAEREETAPLQIVSLEGNKITLRGSAERLKPGDRLALAAPRLTQQVVHFGKQPDVHPGEQLAIVGRGTAPTLATVAGIDPATGVGVLDFGRGERAALGVEERFSAFAVFNTDFGGAFNAFARRQMLHVCWIGCQCSSSTSDGCAPPPDRGPCD